MDEEKSEIPTLSLKIEYYYHPIIAIGVAPIVLTIHGQFPSDGILCKTSPFTDDGFNQMNGNVTDSI